MKSRTYRLGVWREAAIDKKSDSGRVSIELCLQEVGPLIDQCRFMRIYAQKAGVRGKGSNYIVFGRQRHNNK